MNHPNRIALLAAQVPLVLAMGLFSHLASAIDDDSIDAQMQRSLKRSEEQLQEMHDEQQQELVQRMEQEHQDHLDNLPNVTSPSCQKEFFGLNRALSDDDAGETPSPGSQYPAGVYQSARVGLLDTGKSQKDFRKCLANANTQNQTQSDPKLKEQVSRRLSMLYKSLNGGATDRKMLNLGPDANNAAAANSSVLSGNSNIVY